MDDNVDDFDWNLNAFLQSFETFKRETFDYIHSLETIEGQMFALSTGDQRIRIRLGGMLSNGTYPTRQEVLPVVEKADLEHSIVTDGVIEKAAEDLRSQKSVFEASPNQPGGRVISQAITKLVRDLAPKCVREIRRYGEKVSWAWVEGVMSIVKNLDYPGHNAQRRDELRNKARTAGDEYEARARDLEREVIRSGTALEEAGRRLIVAPPEPRSSVRVAGPPLLTATPPKKKLFLTVIAYEHSSTLSSVKDAKLLKDQSVDFDRSQAERGSAIAQFNLGVRFFIGKGLAQDPAVARDWFLKAAKQGNAMALYNIGVMMEQGEGGPTDAERAKFFFDKAFGP